MITHLLLIQAFIPVKAIFFTLNQADWFLSAMVLLYALFPLAKRLLHKADLRKTAIIMVTALFFKTVFCFFFYQLSKVQLISEILPHLELWGSYVCPMTRFGDFLVGCCIGKLYCIMYGRGNELGNRVLCHNVTFFSSIIEVGVLIVCIIQLWAFDLFPTWANHSLLYILPSAVLVFCFAYKQGIITKIMSNRVMISIGNLSDCTFLIHAMVIVIWNDIFGKVSLIGTYVVSLLLAKLYLVIRLHLSKAWCH